MSALRSMSLRRLGEILALFVLTGAAHAAPVTVGPIVITVPQGFVAAQTQKQKKALITAWTKSLQGSKTLLQISVIDLVRPAAPEAAEKFLRQALDEIARRRSSYAASPVAHIALAGVPAVRASWNGSIGGYAVMGVVYSVIVKERYLVKFLAQDLGNTPTDGVFEAMQAIESIGMS